MPNENLYSMANTLELSVANIEEQTQFIIQTIANLEQGVESIRTSALRVSNHMAEPYRELPERIILRDTENLITAILQLKTVVRKHTKRILDHSINYVIASTYEESLGASEQDHPLTKMAYAKIRKSIEQLKSIHKLLDDTTH